jgi:hypothetical protein
LPGRIQNAPFETENVSAGEAVVLESAPPVAFLPISGRVAFPVFHEFGFVGDHDPAEAPYVGSKKY